MLKQFRKFRRDEGGNPTMEFIIFLPLFMFMFLMSFEAGYYMLRGVMLERGVDMAVRQVRLSNGAVPDYTLLKKQICSISSLPESKAAPNPDQPLDNFPVFAVFSAISCVRECEPQIRQRTSKCLELAGRCPNPCPKTRLMPC